MNKRQRKKMARKAGIDLGPRWKIDPLLHYICYTVGAKRRDGRPSARLEMRNRTGVLKVRLVYAGRLEPLPFNPD